ncbi:MULTISPECIES: RNA polymerase sigma factor [Roseovarius]|uniref:RNA polymerase sigma factor n=1 Tax=Roseovarius TaxID=74030 RepID=UPI001C98DF14|nr:sigma-70 family RNA polymerase sigma factor [Roseovarius atlanticus]MBY5989444.1 sigma-70 family RNA polymerase sigma factor [Roseovarius atlanticus]MBY6124836.1 sigma-70 family RNA polymerase sigma factor [Roseovarius atlanticus]MBY6149331.1 sigma-70 family RNA polymerase sigma factor [Roseovarius atlanticus]
MQNSELAELLRRMAASDRDAFAAFYKALEKPVFRFIVSKMNDPHEAADIHHDVFMDIWRSAGRFEGRSTVKTWVFGIAYRKTMDHFRKHKRVDLTDEIDERVDDSPDAATCLASAQEAEHLRHCLDQLKPQHRAAVELAFYQDMTYGEIASVAEVPEGTIKTRVFHAKKLLLHCLSGRMEVRS